CIEPRAAIGRNSRVTNPRDRSVAIGTVQPDAVYCAADRVESRLPFRTSRTRHRRIPTRTVRSTRESPGSLRTACVGPCNLQRGFGNAPGTQGAWAAEAFRLQPRSHPWRNPLVELA